MYMRKILIMLLLLTASLCGRAQTGLHINELFAGRVIPQERMVETRVRGKSIEKYQLSYYRSIRLNATDKEAAQLRQLIGQDQEATSIDSRTSRQNPHSWKTLTVKMQMPPEDGKNRFLCYQEQRKDEHWEVTVIYMEGTVGSLEQLEELLK